MEAVAIKEAPAITTLQLHHALDVELKHWLLGQTLKRIRRFCEKYDSDADPVVFTRQVEKDFAKDQDHDYLILIAVEDMKVVGHLLAERYHYYGRSYVFINQLELDERLSLEEQRKAFQAVVDWHRELRSWGIRGATANPALLPWFKAFGFSRVRSLMNWKESDNGWQ